MYIFIIHLLTLFIAISWDYLGYDWEEGERSELGYPMTIKPGQEWLYFIVGNKNLKQQ